MSTVKELKQQLNAAGIPYSSKAKKDELVALLATSGGAVKKGTKHAVDHDDDDEGKEEQEGGGSSSAVKKSKSVHENEHFLDALFVGVGEEWKDALMPVLRHYEQQAEVFLGPSRAKDIVPVREMTLQALKANSPQGWSCVVFGQQPYPRLESATGVAMFDNSFNDWEDSRFGKVVSMRCLIKAAAMHKYKISKSTKTEDLRKLIRSKGIVSPPGWFASLLSQGVLLLNAALTVSADDGLSLTQHTKFWSPIIERIVECLLEARAKSKEPAGIVFAWWGSKADALRRMVERVCSRYPTVPVRHCVHANPAAQGDLFCDGDVFGDLNAALQSMSLKAVDWLPVESEQKKDEKMSKFITDTSEMHRVFTERLGGVKDELQEQLIPISLDQKVVSFDVAMVPLQDVVERLDNVIFEAQDFAESDPDVSGLKQDEICAVHAYTQAGEFFRLLNASLRSPDRSIVEPFKPFLRLFLSALENLRKASKSSTPLLYRGVAADLRAMYRQGTRIVWWGVSSCTADKSVAEAFVGLSGARCLFYVHAQSAVSVDHCSAIPDEAEWIIPPGVTFLVCKVSAQTSGLCVIELQEEPTVKRLVQ